MDNTFDKMFYNKGDLIGGIDESGIVDIAGPIIAACVILPKIDLHKDDLRIFEVNDCKQVPKRLRKHLAEIVWQMAIGIGIGEVQPSEIDYFGREFAKNLVMMRALAACKRVGSRNPITPDFLLIDGRRNFKTNMPAKCISKGDEKSLAIASASIVAKVYRDILMENIHAEYPYYDLINNKGFPSDSHIIGLDEYGPQIGVHRLKSWPFVPGKSKNNDDSVWIKKRKAWKQLARKRTTEEARGDEWITKQESLQGLTTLTSSVEKERLLN